MKKTILNKPPIDQVIIAVEIPDLFTNKDDIDLFKEKFSLKKQYSNMQEIKSISFEIGETPKIINEVSEIYDFSNDAKTEQLQIGQSKLLFIDRNKYTKFDNFISKFDKILDDTHKIFKRDVNIKTIGLRYINIFDFNDETYKNHFKIKTDIGIKEEDIQFGLLNNFMSVFNIQSSINVNIYANIKTFFKLQNNNLFNIVFDIDTKRENVSNYKQDIIELKNFENEIFFNNFIDIETIKEFQ